MPMSASYRKRNRSNNFLTSCEHDDHSSSDVARSPAPCPTPARGRRRLSTKQHSQLICDAAALPDAAKPAAASAAASAVKAWQSDCEEASAVYDVVADSSGARQLLPLSGGEPRAIQDVSDDEVVTIRVFRFFEDKSDEARIWERELRNVNSGSLLWLVVHLQPKMHSVSGAKYGRWFTAHHVRVYARHLKSGYFMFEEGACPLAKTFGATAAVKGLVSGEKLANGYFWFASPDRHGSGPSHKDVADDECLEKHGWQHRSRQGLFNGDTFLSEWCKLGSAIDELCLQKVLRGLVPEEGQ